MRGGEGRRDGLWDVLELKFVNHSQLVHKHTMTLLTQGQRVHQSARVCVGLCATCSHRYTLLLLHI